LGDLWAKYDPEISVRKTALVNELLLACKAVV